MEVAESLTELQDQIREKYDGLSKRLQEVAGYVIDNPESVACDTVTSIAETVNVPPSTLIRFASAFGFSGFNEMKQLFRDDLIDKTQSYTDRVKLVKKFEGDNFTLGNPSSVLEAFSQANIHAMQRLASQTQSEKLEKAVDLLDSAKNVYLIGMQRSFSVAYYLSYALRHLNQPAFLVDNLGGMAKEELGLVEEQDVVVLVSFSPYSKEAVSLGEIASAAGAKLILISDSELNPLGAFSDVCFVVKEAEIGAFRLQTATQCLAQALAVSLAFKKERDENGADTF